MAAVPPASLPGGYHRSGKALNSAFHARHCSPRCSTGRPGRPSREGIRIPALRLYQRIVADYPVHYYTTQGHASLQAAGVRSALRHWQEHSHDSCAPPGSCLAPGTSPRGSPAKPASTSSACRNCNSYRCINRQGKKSAASLRCCPALRPRSTLSPRFMSITSNTCRPSARSTV